MNILVPTRNNPAGLAGLLSSILAHSAPEEGKHELFLMDGSNEPVITHPHLSRLLTCFSLHYKHYLTPQVNVQRLHGLSYITQHGGPRAICMVVDDDHVLLENPQSASLDLERDTDSYAYFGVCVDILNDKGFSDYSMFSDKFTHHSFGPKVQHGPVEHKALADFSANPGFMVCRAEQAADLLCSFHRQHASTPAIADDAWAKALARKSSYLHTSLRAYHIGNSNRWWNQWGIKHEAVRMAVKEVEGD